MPFNNDRHSADPDFLERYLGGCSVATGTDNPLYLDGELVHIAVVHDSSSYTPTAAIAVSEAHVHEALQAAHDALRDFLVENYPCHIRELQEEHGDDDWEQVLTEPFDGMTWTLPAHTAAKSICADRFAYLHVAIQPSR